LVIAIIFAASLITAGAAWYSKKSNWGRPCPAGFSWILYNPYTRFVAGSALLIKRAAVKPAIDVLDAGCGPGRLTIPLARAVGPEGTVTALDVQQKMLEKVNKKARTAGLPNVRTVRGSLGRQAVREFENVFDRAFLVTVLGEIPDKQSALTEIYRALKPGGVLSITEMLPDPHYQNRNRVRRLAEGAGFRFDAAYGPWFAFTINFVKPATVHSPTGFVGPRRTRTGTT
jgi:ubiquinone/menaquinone biosynthesis C-methylase UbiE